MRKILKLIYQFFLTIYIFESNSQIKKISKKKGISIFFIRSLDKSKNSIIFKKYFELNKSKLNRFKSKSKFIGLKRKDEIICSGWIYFGKKWKVEEVNKEIFLDNQYLLYDFVTEKKFRNQGYYKLLLQIIQNKFRRKKLVIYSLSHNIKSIRAIEKSGFKLFKKIKKYKF